MTDSKSWLDDPEQHIKIVCRLCGDVWKFPLTYKYTFESGRGWECPNCKRKWKEIHGRDTVSY